VRKVQRKKLRVRSRRLGSRVRRLGNGIGGSIRKLLLPATTRTEESTETEVAETETESAESEVVEPVVAETDATPTEETETVDSAERTRKKKNSFRLASPVNRNLTETSLCRLVRKSGYTISPEI
jgi:hypothetical protein